MSKKVFIFRSLFVGIALFRGFYAFNGDGQSNIDCVKDIVRGIGEVVEGPVRKENNQTLIVQSSKIFVASTSVPCANDLLIKINTKTYPTFSFRNIVSFKGRLLEPRNFESNNDRIFDYKNYLAKDDIYFEMKSAVVVATSSVAKLEGGNITGDFFDEIKSLLFGLKKSFVRSLENNLGEPHSSLASGLVVGEKSALGKDLLDDFRRVGLIHIVVLSGYNITIIADAMRRILVFLPRVWGIFFGGLSIAIFGILVGGGATVVRSCLMAGIALFATLIRRDYSVIRSLILVALLMLIENPKILFYDPSFQLSFLATLGLIILAKPVENKLHFITEKFGIRGIVASTVATQIFVSPYILYTMGQISIIGMLVNILVLPFIPVTMFFVFIVGMSGMFVSSVALPFAWVSHVLLSYELFIVDYFARLPFASIDVGKFSFWFVVGFYIVIIGIFIWNKVCSIEKTRNNKFSQSSLLSLFDEFQRLPKSVLIDNPDTFIETDFRLFVRLKLFDLENVRIVFTRRTLKHLAEKKDLGEKLFELIPTIVRYPDCIYKGRSKRLLFVKLFNYGKKKEPHLVIVEISSKGNIIITAFVTDEKYLKNFEILWRTGGSQL